MENENKENQDLFADFEIKDNSEVSDYFTEEKVETSTASEEEPKEEKKKVSEEEIKKEEETEDDIFSSLEEGSEEPLTEEKEKKEVKQEEPVSDSVSTLNFLKEKGLINYELEEGEELTPELATELLEDSYEESVETKVGELIDGLPDLVKGLNKFVLKGGDPYEYLKDVVKPDMSKSLDSFDIESESDQEAILQYQLQKEGKTKEEVEDLISYYKESNKLKFNAEQNLKRLQDNQKKEKEAKIAQQTKLREAQKEAERKRLKDLKEFVSSTKQVGEFKISKKDAAELPTYISEKTIELDNGNKVTEMHYQLYEALNDQEKVLQLAKILKSDFDFSSLKTSAKKEVTQEVKKNIRRKSPEKQNKALHEYFK